jgi:hypothetical protein
MVNLSLQRFGKVAAAPIPCDHIEGEEGCSHALFSDDRGRRWRLGERIGRGGFECEAVELADRRLLRNMRHHDRHEAHRKIAFSADGGETWSSFQSDPALLGPEGHAGIRRIPGPKTAGAVSSHSVIRPARISVRTRAGGI